MKRIFLGRVLPFALLLGFGACTQSDGG